jgi:hypothetical protein
MVSIRPELFNYVVVEYRKSPVIPDQTVCELVDAKEGIFVN